MKTLLVGINAKYIHTNLAIRYLYTYSKDFSDVSFIEFTIKDKKENIIQEILSLKPDLIGFSCYIWNIEIIQSIIKTIKETSKKTKILLGGPEVSYDIHHWFMMLPIDYIISGEGEYPFKQLLTKLQSNDSLKSVPQLHYRLNQQIYSNPDNYVIDLDRLETPYRIPSDQKLLKNRIQYIESSRGCPYRCSYCLASLEKNVRFFNPEFVKKEILYLMDHGAIVFKFLDRTFNARKDYALDIFQFIIAHYRPDCVFQFEITGELLDDAVIDYLNEHAPKHYIRFEIGIQSTNELTNQLVLRKQNFNKLRRNILRIEKGNKIDLHLDLIAGLPKEDYTSFTKTFNDVFHLQPHELQLGFLKMLRGTKLRDEAKLYQYEYKTNAPYEIIQNADISQEEIKKIHAAEHILDIYYNQHRFDRSLTYIINSYYKNNNYKFFENYGLYYQIQYPKPNYQLYDLCTRIIAFLKLENHNIENVTSLLIYDYLKPAKTKPKIWYESQVSREEKHEIFDKFIKHYPDFNKDFLFRYGLTEKLSIHPITYELGNYYLLKLFHEDNQNTYILENKAYEL